MNPKNSPSLRWRTPRALALFGLMALIAVVIVLAFTQTSTVAAPPPPLRGPFRFVELPKEMSAAVASTAVFSWTPFYTQTFESGFSGWTLTRSLALYATPSTLQWDRVTVSQYPVEPFTDTLWSGAFMQYRGTNYTVFSDSTQYTQTMDTWAIYGPLDTQKYAHLRAEFDFYLDAGPGAYFGWGASNDGQTFCGKLGSATTGSRIQQWQHMTFDLTECSAGAGTPVYLAFFFQSSDTTPPAGLGAFVDNLVISGQVWNKVYMPLVRKDLTPTPAALPTPTGLPYTIDHAYDFETGTASTYDWCQTSNDNWAAGLRSLGGSNAYYFKIKSTQYKWALSPRGPSSDNYTLVAQFSLLGMTDAVSLANYGTVQFGVVFSVYGDPFADTDHCSWRGDSSNGGYYKFYIRIKSDGSGFRTRLARSESSGSGLVEPEEAHSGFKDLPLGLSISRTSWNTLQIDRSHTNNTIVVYINGTPVESWSPTVNTGGGYFGLFAEADNTSTNLDGNFEADWDNIIDYRR